MIPDIPGYLIQDATQLNDLKVHLAELCQQHSTRFPGSQPVSFDRSSLDLLEHEDFWVCEKSDGVRVLVLIVARETGQEVYLIDRKEDFYFNEGLTFPHQDGPAYNHSNTVLDGELVVDIDKATGQKTLRLLAFDLLVCDSENLMAKPLSSRYGRLKSWVVTPYENLLKSEPGRREHQPFEVVAKKQELSYGIEAVFREHLPQLQHGNDGLIFTSAEARYTAGTDPKILKWKPPSENSIDFVLQLKFPATEDGGSDPDFTAKPYFRLLTNWGRGDLRYFDTMEVDDTTWEEWKATGEQYDDRVVEVLWDKDRETWKVLRFRDDKLEGNFHKVVDSIITSIKHGVEAETLIEHAAQIKKAWKARQYARNPQQQPPPASGAGGHQNGRPHPPPPQQLSRHSGPQTIGGLKR